MLSAYYVPDTDLFAVYQRSKVMTGDMWQLYDALIEGVDGSRRVDYACCGSWRAWVESEGRGGLASLLVNGGVVSRPTGELTQYAGWRLRDLAALCKSWDPREAALGVAALNAYYNDISLLEKSPSLLYPGDSEAGDAFSRLLPEARGKKVATVGHFNGVDRMYGPVCDFTVFERETRDGDLPDAAEEYLLPHMDLVFITGMSLTNKTLPRLLQLAAGRVVLTGPSLPMTEVFFRFGADMLSGMAVSKPQQGRAAVVSADWHAVYECSSKVLWSRA